MNWIVDALIVIVNSIIKIVYIIIGIVDTTFRNVNGTTKFVEAVDGCNEK